jgi:Family of unknown function (DUF6161)
MGPTMMADGQKPFFLVELPHRPLTFGGFDEIVGWISREQQQFRWLLDAGDIGPEANALREKYRNGLGQLLNRVQEWRVDPDNSVRAQALTNQFMSFYGANGVLLSDQPAVKIAGEIEKECGARASAGAFALLIGVPCNADFHTVQGFIHAISARDGISPRSPALVQSTIAALTESAGQAARQREQTWSGVEKNAQEFFTNSQSSVEKQSVEASERIQQFLDRLNAEGDHVIKSIQNTEAAYKEQMRLQAPVDYWESKANAHRSDVAKSRRRLVTFAVLATIGLVAAIVAFAIVAAMIAPEKSADSIAVYLKFAAAGAILTTIAFWVGRVLLRIYLSDRHLLTDAEERVAMIKTYLALTNEGKVEATDRALVLAPIFRSAADGIVKEEGPDASFAGVLARALDIRGRGG